MTWRIAVIGDIHGHWTPDDTVWFDRSGVDLVLVVGDLAGLRWSGTLAVASELARLTVPMVLIPGNHDATHPVQLGAEVLGVPSLGGRLAGTQAARVATLEQAVAPHAVGAWSTHPVGGPDGLTLIAGRPHSMGGPSMAFAAYLQARWGVMDLEASAARLRALVDACDTEDVIFAAHNGPAGLGDRREDIWGRDFDPRQGDWGDADLRDAIAHARATGHRVRAVIAGHMHRRLRGGGARIDRLERDGVQYVNAAEVPRITGGRHHHVAVELGPDTVEAVDCWVDPREGR